MANNTTADCQDLDFLDVVSDSAGAFTGDYGDVDFALPYFGSAEDVAFIEDLTDRLAAESAKYRAVPGLFTKWAVLEKAMHGRKHTEISAAQVAAAGYLGFLQEDRSVGSETLRQHWLPAEEFEGKVCPIGYEPPYPACESGHRMRVLDSIGQAHETEIRSLIAQYEPLTKTDLPLHGKADADRVQAVLDAEYPWAIDVNEAACELLALASAVGKRWLWVPPIILAGDPGTGKTRWARRLAEVGGVGFECMPDGGDRLAISGLQRSWRGAEPCLPVKAMGKLKTANPLICVDEIDKAARHHDMGSAQDALLPFLERGTASRHRDPCLEGNLDARWVSWILTANDLSQISDPLISRCRVLHMPLPRPCDFDVLLNGVLRDIAKQWQCAPERLPELSSASVDRLRKRFLETLVPRRLRVDVESALAKAASRREWVSPVEHHERTRIGFCL